MSRWNAASASSTVVFTFGVLLVSLQCGDRRFESIEAVLFDKDGTLAKSEAFLNQLGQLRLRFLESSFPNAKVILSDVLGLAENWVDPTGLLAVGSREANAGAIVEELTKRGMERTDALETVDAAFLRADQGLPRKAPATPLISGCQDLIQCLFEGGVRIGIVSSDTTDNLHDFLNYYGLTPYVQQVVGADRGLVKPDPLLMKQTCQRMGVGVENTLMIGDAEPDMAMARSAQAGGAVGVSWGWKTPIVLTGADIMVDQPAQIQIVS